MCQCFCEAGMRACAPAARRAPIRGLDLVCGAHARGRGCCGGARAAEELCARSVRGAQRRSSRGARRAARSSRCASDSPLARPPAGAEPGRSWPCTLHVKSQHVAVSTAFQHAQCSKKSLE